MNPKWKMSQVLSESWDVDDEILKEFGIQKSWLNRFPQELSGGELQRFSVLRSLNPNTKFLIADEMTTMLDAITQVQILDSVLKIVKQRKMGFLLVSHDMDLVDTICDDKIYLNDINKI
jgi:peptide/nickel transport system ATP-binding protein